MTIGNVWLGNMQMDLYATTQQLGVTTTTFSLSTTTYSTPAVLDRVTVRLSGVSETLNIWLSPASGADYKTLVYNTSTIGKTSVFYTPTRPLFLYPGDTAILEITNANKTGYVAATITTLY